MRKPIMAALFVLLLAAIVFTALAYYQNSNADEPISEKGVNSAQILSKDTVFDKNLYSMNYPGSIWVVVNKQRPVEPKDYVPTDLVVPSVEQRVPGNESMKLRAVTAKALKDMFDAAAKDGIVLMLSSGYRSYSYQVNLYGNYVKSQGQTTADSLSARPGYSEHQTGLAVDLRTNNGQCELNKCFGDLPEGKWIAANAYRYGFIIRYPDGKKSVVGYEYEPWHIRYVGKDLANDYHKTNATSLEEYFNLPPAPDYK